MRHYGYLETCADMVLETKGMDSEAKARRPISPRSMTVISAFLDGV